MAGIAAMGGGDGEDDEWSKIPEFVKERSLIIPSPFSKEGYFAIPIPLGFHFLPNIGRLMVEIGPTQAAQVTALMAAAELSDLRVLHDLDGRDRVVCGRKPQ